MERACGEGELLGEVGQRLHRVSERHNVTAKPLVDRGLTDSASCQSRSHCVFVVASEVDED